jgi:peptidoglycan/LPS O-acetylase OafA/YrhL
MKLNRTVSTAHLVFGIIFTGVAALWLIGQATDAKLHDTAPGFPAVLIGAGIVGLIASVVNARSRRQAELPSYDAQPAGEVLTETLTETPTDLTEEQS